MTQDLSEFEVDYLTCASRLSESLNGDAYLEIAEGVALQNIEAGELERGVELTEHISDAYARDSALAVITAKAVESEREDYATELLETIEDPILYNSAIEGMSIEFAKRGEFDTALNLVDQLSDNDLALSSIATVYWQRGLKDEAVELARSIESTQQSAATLTQLARLSDQKDESSDLLLEARRVAEEIDSVELKVAALIAIASGYEAQADREQSVETLNRALEVCEDFENASVIGLSGGFPKDEVLLQILEAFLRLQDPSKATEIAETIDDELLFTRANLLLAVASGQPGETAKALDEVMADIEELQTYSEQEREVRDALKIELALAYANVRHYAEARRTVNSLTSERNQIVALKELGKLYAKAEYDQGIFDVEEDLGSHFDRAQYWVEIYDATSSRSTELSQKALAKALLSAECIERPVEQAEAFTEIALRFAKNQRTGESERLFLAATNAATLIEGNFLKARAFLRLAKAAQDIGRKPNQDEQPLLLNVSVSLW